MLQLESQVLNNAPVDLKTAWRVLDLTRFFEEARCLVAALPGSAVAWQAVYSIMLPNTPVRVSSPLGSGERLKLQYILEISGEVI